MATGWFIYKLYVYITVYICNLYKNSQKYKWLGSLEDRYENEIFDKKL
jgi:hypothetical protein